MRKQVVSETGDSAWSTPVFRRIDVWLVLLLLLGVFLRIHYFLVTPLGLRGHDTAEHILYVRYVVEHLALPSANAGWETHQFPLYYIIAAGVEILGLMAHLTESSILSMLQAGSLLLSIVTLGISFLVIREVFGKGEKIQRRIAWAVLATLPALLFPAADINNDALAFPMAFLCMLFLIRWVKAPTMRRALVLGTITALAILTKASALLWLPVILVCVCRHPGITAKERWRQLMAIAVLVLLFAGWMVVLRVMIEHDPQQRYLHPFFPVEFFSLCMGNSPGFFLTMNPVRVLQSPFIRGGTDLGYLWEFFLRSLFTNEGDVGNTMMPVLRALLALAMLMIPVAVTGFFTKGSKKRMVEFACGLVLLTFLGGLVLYRAFIPCVYMQDFRYIPVVAIPCVYYLARGLERLRRKGFPLEIAPVLFVVLCTLYVLRF